MYLLLTNKEEKTKNKEEMMIKRLILGLLKLSSKRLI